MSQISLGADFILHVADICGRGVIRAAEERNIYAFGAVSDQKQLSEDTVLTSFVLDMEKAYDGAVSMVRENNFRGEILRPGLEIERGGQGTA
jgi:basic membrane protein A and related proteins